MRVVAMEPEWQTALNDAHGAVKLNVNETSMRGCSQDQVAVFCD